MKEKYKLAEPETRMKLPSVTRMKEREKELTVLATFSFSWAVLPAIESY